MRKDERADAADAEEEIDLVENTIDVTEPGADVVDLQRDPPPPLPEYVELPRDEALSTLRDVQEFSYRRRLWGKAFRFKATETAAEPGSTEATDEPKATEPPKDQ